MRSAVRNSGSAGTGADHDLIVLSAERCTFLGRPAALKPPHSVILLRSRRGSLTRTASTPTVAPSAPLLRPTRPQPRHVKGTSDHLRDRHACLLASPSTRSQTGEFVPLPPPETASTTSMVWAAGARMQNAGVAKTTTNGTAGQGVCNRVARSAVSGGFRRRDLLRRFGGGRGLFDAGPLPSPGAG